MKDEKIYSTFIEEKLEKLWKNVRIEWYQKKWFQKINLACKGVNKSYHQIFDNGNHKSDKERDKIINNKYEFFIKRNPKSESSITKTLLII